MALNIPPGIGFSAFKDSPLTFHQQKGVGEQCSGTHSTCLNEYSCNNHLPHSMQYNLFDWQPTDHFECSLLLPCSLFHMQHLHDGLQSPSHLSFFYSTSRAVTSTMSSDKGSNCMETSSLVYPFHFTITWLLEPWWLPMPFTHPIMWWGNLINSEFPALNLVTQNIYF